jgi:hypothetical protein
MLGHHAMIQRRGPAAKWSVTSKAMSRAHVAPSDGAVAASDLPAALPRGGSGPWGKKGFDRGLRDHQPVHHHQQCQYRTRSAALVPNERREKYHQRSDRAE